MLISRSRPGSSDACSCSSSSTGISSPYCVNAVLLVSDVVQAVRIRRRSMGGERAWGRISIPGHDRRALTHNAHDNGYQLFGDDLGQDLDDDAQRDPGE